MKNYKKISLFLLLSAAVTITAFDPYQTSGVPDRGDFDDQTGDFRRDYRKTSLEKEAEKQPELGKKAPLEPTPSLQPTPQKNQNSFFEKQKKRAAEKKAVDTLSNEFLAVCSEIQMENDALRKKEETLEADYNAALAEISEKKSLGRYEIVGTIVTACALSAALITDIRENINFFAGAAIIAGVTTACSYIPRYRNAQQELKEISRTHAAELQKAAETTRTPNAKKEELIKKAQALLTQLQSFPYAENIISTFEGELERLSA